jgi:VWFA-related protein
MMVPGAGRGWFGLMGSIAIIAMQATSAAGLAAAKPAAQEDSARIRIVYPEDGTYMSGPVTLRAVVVPLSATKLIVTLSFFADGRQVCVLDKPPFECPWDAGARIREHAIRVVAVLETGQQLRQNVRTKGLDYAETVDVDVIQVTAVVTDGAGRFVKGLERGDFKVYEDDVLQKISYFGTADQAPLELVAAIDVSGSMLGAMPEVKAAAKTFLSSLRPEDQVSLLAFNDNLMTPVRRSTDPAVRLRAVDRLQAWGGTALYDVIIKALDMVGRQQGRRAIVVFSDGQDENSFARVDTVIRRVEASDSTLYMIGQGEATRSEELQVLLHDLATVSGGRAFSTDDPGRLEQAFAEIIQDLSNQYLLAYAPTRATRDDRWHRIRVEVGDGHFKVRARQRYRAVKNE